MGGIDTSKRFADEQGLRALARERVLERLRAQLARDGALSAVVVSQAAGELGCSARSLWRWLADGPPARSAPAGLDEELYGAYVRWHGNVAAARRELLDAGRQVASLRTLQRVIAAQLHPAERATARSGEAALRAHGLYVRWEADHRNEVWQGDHKLLDVLVLAPRAAHPQRPWSTIFIDARSRAIMGWALSLHPSSAEVLAALREGMLLDPEALGGVPERLRIDHGLEFCANAIREACAALDVQFSLARQFTPEEKGKIERLHWTLVQTLLCGLPYYTDGRRDIKGRLQDRGAPLTLQAFVDRFAGWVPDYNRREHSQLDGHTPLEIFTSDPTPLRAITPSHARALLVARKTVRVGRYGVAHRGWFTAPALNELVGEEVQIAFAPHDRRSVEVYWRGEHVCTALPQDSLTPDQQQQIIQARREHAKQLRARQRAALRATRDRVAPITDSARAPVQLLELRTADLGELRHAGDAALQAGARVDLLVDRSGPPRAKRP